MKRIPFNVNDCVWVTLTDFGRDDIRQLWKFVADMTKRPVDEVVSEMHPEWLSGNPVRMQMHKFMEYFGPSMAGLCHGNLRIPFKTNIEIEVGENA